MPRQRRVRQPKQTALEINKNCMESSLDDCRSERIPEPTRQHAIGDLIRYGAWDWNAILEVLDDGKIYKVFSVTRHTKRNIPDATEFKIHYLTWYTFVPEMTDDEYEATERVTQDKDIFFQYAQRDVYALLNMSFDQFGFDFDADYQRGYVWTLEQKVDLIHSIFRNIDIGKFVIIKRPWGDNPNVPATPLLYEVLDGKQRITALLDFYLNRIQYKGKYFTELHPRDRGHFRHYRISYAETKPLTQEQKYRYFLKLNTTGMPVDPKHIEKVEEMWRKEKDKVG